jgi:predicted HTH domain antitoxin
MSVIAVEMGDDLVRLLGGVADSPEAAVRQLVVVELYRRGAISLGKGADLLGMPLVEFIQFTGSLGIPYLNWTEEDWEVERQAIGEMRHS